MKWFLDWPEPFSRFLNRILLLICLVVSDYVLEENAREYVDSVHIEDDPVDKYSLPEQQQQEEFESEVVVEEAPVEDLVASHQNVVNSVQEPISAVNDEPIGEPEKKTYASIVSTHYHSDAAGACVFALYVCSHNSNKPLASFNI